MLEAVNHIENFKLVLTLRADFFGYALSYRPFADALQDAVQTIGPMNRGELQEAIEQPAQLLGVMLESGLTERILEAVEDEPGNLPLLEFALTLLWANQQNGQLTHEAYEEIGGVEQALAQYAEEQYESLSEEDKQRTQRVFIQLVRPGAGTEDTRRLATLAEVGEDNWDLVTRLASARLVVTGSRLVATECDEPKVEETVEIVHEALIREWQRLREWMEDNREFRTWQERLKTRIQEWKEGQGELLSKTRLKIAEEWRQKRGQELSSEQENFIKKSRQRQNRNLWLGMGIVIPILIIGVLTGAEIYKKSCDVGERVGQDCFRFIITSGDSQLFVGTTNQYLENGVKNFDKKNFDAAEKDFEKAKNVAPYDPIPLIYYNNAKALREGNPYKLGVVVPVDAHEEIARNMLRGVAYAQDKFNENRKGSEPLLEIIIANDKNDEKISNEIAKRLVRENILGVVGHRSSSSSLAAIPRYEKKGIPMVSPTSASTDLDKYKNRVFIRGAASNKKFAKIIYDYASKNCLNEKKDNQVWLVYESKDNYSNNFKHEYLNYSEESEEKISTIETDLNDLAKKKEEDLKYEIQEKIENKRVKCAIIMPSTKGNSAALSIIFAHKKLYEEEKQPSKDKIKFLVDMDLHNNENNEVLKDVVFPVEDDILVLETKPKLDKYEGECKINDKLTRNIKECIDDKWKKKVGWRTYTSYEATQLLIKGLKQLDGKNEKSTSEWRKRILNHLKESTLDEKDDLKACLVSFNNILKDECIAGTLE